MGVPSSINDLSTTAGSNPPSGAETPAEGDNHIRQIYAFLATIRDIGSTRAAFSARVSTPSQQTSGTVAVFGTERFDVTGAYNNATGVFTAPVAGVYHFSATVLMVAGGSYIFNDAIALKASSAGFLDVVPIVSTGATSAKLCATEKLQAGETVSVVLASGAAFSAATLVVDNTLISAGTNWFSGAMLY